MPSYIMVRHVTLPKENLRDETIVPRLQSRHVKLSEERLRGETKERLCRSQTSVKQAFDDTY